MSMKRHRKQYFSSLLLALGLFLAFPTITQAQGLAVKLALLSEEPAASSALDWLTVELSKRPELALLERAEMERLIREQALSAAHGDYLKLGQVLGADGLLVLSLINEPSGQSLETRLVAVRPGVVLGVVRTPWPLEDGIPWAAGLGQYYAPLFPKLKILAKDAIPISVLNLRAAAQSAAGRDLERQLTLLTVECLSRQPEVFVLERRRMDLLGAEKADRGLDDSSFWNGSFLLDAVLDRDGFSETTLTVDGRLVAPKGQAPLPLKLQGSRTNLLETANRLAAQVLASLKLRPTPVPWDAIDEAERYFAEAQWAYRWRLLSQAAAACEASWALGKKKPPSG